MHQLLNILQGYGVDVLSQVVGSIWLFAEGIDKEFSLAPGQEVVTQGFVGGNEDGSDVSTGTGRAALSESVSSRVEL